MIKIAFVIDTIESPTAGTEKQLLLLIKHLNREKFQPFLCVLRNSEWLKSDFNDCKIIEVGVSSFWNPMTYVNICIFARSLRRHKIDIVQTHFIEGSKIGIIAGKLAGVRAIVATRRNQGYWHNRYEVLISRALNFFVSHFLANSESTRKWSEATEGIDPNRMSVIHNAIDVEQYRDKLPANRLAFRSKLGFPPNAAIVGVVANLRPVKKIDDFIRSAQLISQRCPTARFVIVGEGSERAYLQQLSQELGIGALVHFLGRRTDVPEILSCIDIGVLSSESESFSNSIVEYLAAGLPVVCTDVGGAKEAVEDGGNGYVIEAGDHVAVAEKVLSILLSGGVDTFSQNSRATAQRLFSLPQIISRYSKFYEMVVQS